ncbi:MAG: polyprenyl synthetase family protein [Proteobacteria bacterium]|nr:polyprenyl synthetase family protein [Pseudomonadota bacterium]MBU1686637.1 polyprenyl synthetase family protein [Pseudomonadota bacterium]
MDLPHYLAEKKALVEGAMQNHFPHPKGDQPDHALHLEAMHYSLFADGKRVRPILCLAACAAVGGDELQALSTAVALECIHTYSLIHDDLPAMDNDDLRRGKPTNHVLYGEAQAILAGDGLLTMAFEILATPEPAGTLPPADRLKIIRQIGHGAGSMGMVGGQAIDVAAEGREIDFPTLRQIHSRKTGALITASVQAGALIGCATPTQYEALTRYGNEIGLAFQIIDDLLNVEGTAEQLGKAAGSDAARSKATYPAFFGVELTRTKAIEATDRAIEALDGFDPTLALPLREIARYIQTRKK